MQPFHEQHRMPPGVVLRSDERVLWEGRPHQGLFAFRSIDVLLVPLAVFWAGFAVFWNVAVWAGDGPLLFNLFGLPFLVAGAYITVGRHIHNKISRSKITYVLTNHRAIVVLNNGKRVKEYALSGIRELETSMEKDGSGTIRFAPENSNPFQKATNPQAAFAFWHGAAVDGTSFYRVDDAQRVLALMQDAMYDRNPPPVDQPPPPTSPNRHA